MKLPFKVPGGVLAVAIGWLIAVAQARLCYDWFQPAGGQQDGVDDSLSAFAFPMPRVAFLQTFLHPPFWRCLSVVIPMWLVTLVNNLANIEAASAVGDRYSPRVCLLGCALIDLSCAFLGNPFPSLIWAAPP